MSVTDQNLMEAVQYTLLEPPDLGADWPSGLWTQAEVLGSCNDMQDILLKSSRLLVGQVTLPVALAVTHVALPDDWLITMNVVWRGADGTIRELVRTDQFQADHAHPDWPSTRGTPEVYFDHDQPLLHIQIAPEPDVAGVVDVFYIPSGDPMDGTGVNLTVPDEWEPILRYAVLADLLGKDGRGRSPDRATYCEGRFQLGIEITQMILASSWVGA